MKKAITRIVAWGPALALLAMPMVTLAVTDPSGNVSSVLGLIEMIVGRLIPILVAFSLITFIWGLIRFLLSDDEEKRKSGKQIMLWGIIALFVIVSIWGIVQYIASVFGVDGTTTVNTPQVPFNPAGN